VYDHFDFEIPVASTATIMTLSVRMDEMEQSFRIIEQALDKNSRGPGAFDTEGNVLPADEFAMKAKKAISRKSAQMRAF